MTGEMIGTLAFVIGLILLTVYLLWIDK